MASSLSTIFHRPFTLSPFTSTPSLSSSSSSPSLPSYISFTTPNSRSKALRKATLISACKDGLPAPSERPNPLQFLHKTAVLLTASAALLGCLSSPSFAKTPNPFASLTVVNAEEELEEEKVLEEHLVSNPDDLDYLKALIRVKIHLEKLEEARSVVERLVELDPTSKDWPLMRAQIRIFEGDVEGAKVGLEEIIEQNSLCVDAYHGLVAVASKLGSEEELKGVAKRIEVAIEECKKEKKKEDLREFKLLIAHIRMEEGKYEEALEVYEELVKEEPKDFMPYLCRGIIYMRLKKKDDAEKQFQMYRSLVPEGHPYQKVLHASIVMQKFLSKKEDNLFDKR